MDERQMQHGRDWAGANPRGWFAAEKFRGARAFWDGRTLWSRGGRAIILPVSWRTELPAGFPLDGEVWSGRGPAGGAHEVDAGLAVRLDRFHPGLRFLAFDAPGAAGTWPERMAGVSRQLAGGAIVLPVGFQVVASRHHLEQLWAQVAKKGGEGLILRDPAAPAGYEPGRGRALLKVKHDPAGVRGVVRVF